MKVLICGDRNWEDEEKIRDRVALLPRGTLVVEGGARGADKLAGIAADELGLPHITCNANWDYYKRAAGPIRNRWMLDLLTASDLVIAFHANLKKSKGTKDCVNEAKRRAIPVELIR